jgi:hypothetical protein
MSIKLKMQDVAIVNRAIFNALHFWRSPNLWITPMAAKLNSPININQCPFRIYVICSLSVATLSNAWPKNPNNAFTFLNGDDLIDRWVRYFVHMTAGPTNLQLIDFLLLSQAEVYPWIIT